MMYSIDLGARIWLDIAWIGGRLGGLRFTADDVGYAFSM